MIKEDRSDQDVNAIIAKAQAQIAAGQTTGSGSTTSTKTTTAKPVAVIAAPIPSKPAWQVPPSIVAHASSQVGFLVSSFLQTGKYTSGCILIFWNETIKFTQN